MRALASDLLQGVSYMISCSINRSKPCTFIRVGGLEDLLKGASEKMAMAGCKACMSTMVFIAYLLIKIRHFALVSGLSTGV